MPSNDSSSVVPLSSHLQSDSASGSSQMSQFFASGGQSVGVSASASVLPINIQDLFPLGWTGWISLQSKGFSKVFSNTTVQKHQFFGTQFLYSPTLTSIHDHWKNHSLDYFPFPHLSPPLGPKLLGNWIKPPCYLFLFLFVLLS